MRLRGISDGILIGAGYFKLNSSEYAIKLREYCFNLRHDTKRAVGDFAAVDNVTKKLTIYILGRLKSNDEIKVQRFEILFV